MKKSNAVYIDWDRVRIIFKTSVILTLLLALTSCNGQVKDNTVNADFVQEKSGVTEPAAVNSPENSANPSATPFTTPTAIPSANPSINKDNSTPAQNKASFTEITRREAGLDTIPLLDFNRFNLNPRLKELLQQNNYKDADYAAGIALPVSPDENTYIITGRFAGKIIEDIKIGTDMEQVKNILGVPSVIVNNSIYYKTNSYYLGFKGKTKVEQAIITQNSKEYDKGILLTILNQLSSSSALDKILENNKSFFERTGFVNGGGRYANSNNGIDILEFSKDKRVTVYNNFEGRLYRDDSKKTGYVITYQNIDSVVGLMESGLSNLIAIDQLFEKECTLSPSGKYKAIYQWFYSMSQYFTIRSTDNSRPDFKIRAYTSQGKYKWLSDEYILYIHTFEQIPYILTIGKTHQHINVLKELGVTDNTGINTALDYEITEVGKDAFAVRNKKDNALLKVRFYLDAGKLKLESDTINK